MEHNIQGHSARFHASLAALAATALVVLSSPVTAIVGGSFDGTDHPYAGAIRGAPGPTPDFVASGVLISPRVFLTAGHVTRRFDAAGLTQAMVTFDPVITAFSVWHQGTVHTNPAYDPQSASDPGDVGIVVFDSPIAGVGPALLPALNLFNSIGLQSLRRTPVVVVGYGVSEYPGAADGGGTPHPDLTSGGTRNAMELRPDSTTRPGLRLQEDNHGRVCAGDSGSPVVLDDSDTVVAVTVGTFGQCTSAVWAIRIDTPAARAFIGQYVTLP